MRILHLVIFGLSACILAGCSSTKKASETKEPIRVITEELPPPPPESPEKVAVEYFSIQIGAFEKKENALQFAYNAKHLIKEDIYNFYDKAKLIYRVVVGKFTSKESATEYRDQFVKKYPGYSNAWVIDVNEDLIK